MNKKVAIALGITVCSGALVALTSILFLHNRETNAPEPVFPTEEKEPVDREYTTIVNTGNDIDKVDYTTNVAGTEKTEIHVEPTTITADDGGPEAAWRGVTEYTYGLTFDAKYKALECEASAPTRILGEDLGWGMHLLVDRLEEGRDSTVVNVFEYYFDLNTDTQTILVELSNGECWYCSERHGECWASYGDVDVFDKWVQAYKETMNDEE